MANILIIGSNGFIGQHMYTYFSNSVEYNVWGCGIRPHEKAERYFYIDPFHVSYDAIFQSQSFDLCINCSGSASVPISLEYPLMDFTKNVESVYRMLESIRKYNPACKFINFSSAAVYGNPQALPIKENDPINPISPYGHHKFYSEQILRQFFKNFGSPTISLRVFSAFGPGLQKQLFWDLYTKAKSTLQVHLSGTGQESRDFIYVTDICRAVELIFKNAKFQGEIMNIANGEEILIRHAVDTFYDKMNKDIVVVFDGKPRAGDPLNWRADISTLKEFGYKPEINFEIGILNYVQWLKNSI